MLVPRPPTGDRIIVRAIAAGWLVEDPHHLIPNGLNNKSFLNQYVRLWLSFQSWGIWYRTYRRRNSKGTAIEQPCQPT
jgi:hypothetical protein